jgi:hypothetical protein
VGEIVFVLAVIVLTFFVTLAALKRKARKK